MLTPMRWMIIPSMLSFSTLAFAGGAPTDLPNGADPSENVKNSSASAPTKASKEAKAKSSAAKKVAKKITKASAAKSKKAQQAQTNNEVRSPAGFRAIEDEKLVIDSSQLRDGDGLGEVQLQWQISENGDDWMVIPGAVSEAFTPRDQQVGKYLRVQVSYIDGQGNA